MGEAVADLKRITLELVGNDPDIVLADADPIATATQFSKLPLPTPGKSAKPSRGFMSMGHYVRHSAPSWLGLQKQRNSATTSSKEPPWDRLEPGNMIAFSI